MVEDHPIFEKPTNINQKIWRYLDFTKFIDLLNSQSLFFSRVDQFDDIFEGSVPKNTAKLRNIQVSKFQKKSKDNNKYNIDFWQKKGKEERKNNAINCWHMNDFESAAMWNLYLKSNEGLAIQSTYQKLEDCLNESKLYINLGIIKYIDYDNDIIGWGNGFIPFVHKRKSFEHEKELRALIWKLAKVNTEMQVDFSNGGISVPINIKKLIEKIYVSPDSPLWFTNLVQEITHKLGFDIEVINSSLNENPIF